MATQIIMGFKHEPEVDFSKKKYELDPLFSFSKRQRHYNNAGRGRALV